MTPRPTWQALRRNADLRRFVIARAVSRAGDGIYPVGLTAAMLEAGYGPSAVGYVVAASTGPVVLLMLFGGVLLDNASPRAPMIAADLTRFLLQGAVAIIFLGAGRSTL